MVDKTYIRKYRLYLQLFCQHHCGLIKEEYKMKYRYCKHFIFEEHLVAYSTHGRPVPRGGVSNDPPPPSPQNKKNKKNFWKSIFSVTILFIELYLQSNK